MASARDSGSSDDRFPSESRGVSEAVNQAVADVVGQKWSLQSEQKGYFSAAQMISSKDMWFVNCREVHVEDWLSMFKRNCLDNVSRADLPIDRVKQGCKEGNGFRHEESRRRNSLNRRKE